MYVFGNEVLDAAELGKDRHDMGLAVLPRT